VRSGSERDSNKKRDEANRKQDKKNNLDQKRKRNRMKENE
jgi:hypothetical protein